MESVLQQGQDAVGDVARAVIITSLVTVTCSISRSEWSIIRIIGSSEIKKRSCLRKPFGSFQSTTSVIIEPAGEPNFGGAILHRANLSGAIFSGTDLHDADLGKADLRGTDLRGANLHEANLREANLRGANLREADLREAILEGAILEGADLREAILEGPTFRKKRD